MEEPAWAHWIQLESITQPVANRYISNASFQVHIGAILINQRQSNFKSCTESRVSLGIFSTNKIENAITVKLEAARNSPSKLTFIVQPFKNHWDVISKQ